MNSDMDPRLDHYKTLGVSSTATADEIKKAFRNLAKKYHPDSTGGDKAKEARFKEINQAYDVLSDTKKRAQYDAMRSAGTPFGGFPGGFSGTHAGDDINLGDLFAQMFRGAGGRGGPGGNVHVRFSQGGSPFGADMPFDTEGPLGADPFETGRRRRRRTAPSGPDLAEQKVRASDGSTVTQRGNDIYSDLRLPLDKAILGTVAEVATLEGKAKVKIPPGTSSGVKLRLKGKGARIAGSDRGDHYVTVQIDVPKSLDEEAKKLLIQFMQHVKR